MAGLAGGILVVAALALGYGLAGPPQWHLAIGNDLEFYAAAAERLFTGQGWYMDRQLHGPYEIRFFVDVLYPPVAAYVFAPFIVLPVGALLIIVGGTMAGLAREWRPAPWTWPLIALCVLWPATLLKGLSGNSSLMVAMAVGLGLRFGWPAVFVFLKPSFLPLALIGIRNRSWWVAAVILALLSLPFISETLAYPQVILDSRGDGLGYSLADVPMVLIPILMWLERTKEARRPKGTG